jgi:L-iditol 2-dehydrogenase
MKAAFLIGPKNIVVRETPAPELAPDGLILKTEACGVCGSDLRRWREGPPAGVAHLVQGHELAGTVLRCGPAVSRFKAGDRVAVAPDIHCGECYYCRRGWFNLCANLKLLGITPGLDGGFAEQVALTGEMLRHGIVHLMPEGLGFLEGGFAETLSSVIASQAKSAIGLGETVVVMGAGPIGCLHIVVAQARGATVIVVEPNPVRRQGALKFAPTAVLDPTGLDVVAEVKRRTDGVGADAVICANPVASTQTQAVQMTRRAGHIVLFGGLPKADPMTHLDGNLIHYGEQRVIGAFSYHPSYHEEALRLLARKVVDAAQFITHTRPLSQVAEAFELAQSGDALKVMVQPDQS